ncbi:hypothetical protein AZZ86_004736, partial [Klebsiella pneumoniae]
SIIMTNGFYSKRILICQIKRVAGSRCLVVLISSNRLLNV